MAIPTDPLARIADIVRIGNRAARAAQADNRVRGVANWYSLAGHIVSDRPEPPVILSREAPPADSKPPHASK